MGASSRSSPATVDCQVLAAGRGDEVRINVVPVRFGSGKRYFGTLHASSRWRIPAWWFGATVCFTCVVGCVVERSGRHATRSAGNGGTGSDLRLRLRIAPGD